MFCTHFENSFWNSIHCKFLPSIRICRLKSGQNKKLTLKNGMNESPSAPKKYPDKFSYLSPAVLCRFTACIRSPLRILKSRRKKIGERNLRSFTVVISGLNAWFLSLMRDAWTHLKMQFQHCWPNLIFFKKLCQTGLKAPLNWWNQLKIIWKLLRMSWNAMKCHGCNQWLTDRLTNWPTNWPTNQHSGL